MAVIRESASECPHWLYLLVMGGRKSDVEYLLWLAEQMLVEEVAT